MSTVVQNSFFTLKFFPALHHLSLVRKSNVAYTFTNYGGPVLNDSQLLAEFAKYSGKYRNLNFFKSLPVAFGTASQRIKNRKLIKRSLFEALHNQVPSTPDAVRKISGIWFFKFNAAVATEKDIHTVKKSLALAVRKIYSNASFANEVARITEQQNQDKRAIKQLLREIRPENTLGAARVIGYYPKLPYSRPT